MYYFFEDIINIKSFNLNRIKIGKTSYESIIVSYIGYLTIKYSKYLKMNSVNPWYLFSAKWMNTLKKLIKVSI